MDWIVFFVASIVRTMTLLNVAQLYVFSWQCMWLSCFGGILLSGGMLSFPKLVYSKDGYTPTAYQGYCPPPQPQSGYEPAPADLKGKEISNHECVS